MAFRLSKKFVNSMEEFQKEGGYFIGKLEEYLTDLQQEIDNNQEEYDNHSETWQQGERSEAARDWMDSLNEFMGAIEDAKDYMQTFVDFGVDDRPEN